MSITSPRSSTGKRGTGVGAFVDVEAAAVVVEGAVVVEAAEAEVVVGAVDEAAAAPGGVVLEDIAPPEVEAVFVSAVPAGTSETFMVFLMKPV